tara:strand:+ start:3134 stop:3292 length:159 start_codon:yes stop_codon:yes gene_type:complete
MHYSQFTLTPNGTYFVGEATELDAKGNVPRPRFVEAGSKLGKAIAAAQKKAK